MSDSMIERVAKAIDPDAWSAFTWNIWPPRRVCQWRARRAAIRVIEAMREPTDSVIEGVAIAIWNTKPGSKIHPWASLGSIRETYSEDAREAIQAYVTALAKP